MLLIAILDILSVIWLCSAVSRKGFEGALPVAAFLLMLFPAESQFHLPGLFDLTTQRIIVIALVILFAKAGSRRAKNTPLPLKHLVIPVVGWMIVSSANSVVPDISFKSTLSQCFDYFIPYYIFAKSVSTIETAHKIFLGFVASMFVCSIFGALEIYRGWSVLSLFPPIAHHFSDLAGAVSDRSARAQSTFGHPILFGTALSMAIPMALYLIDVYGNRRRRVFLWCAIMLMMLCIYQTQSRGPWLALSLSLVLLLAFGRQAMRKRLALIAILTAIVLFVRPGVWLTINNLYGETMNPDTAQGESYQWRYVLYNIAKQELSKSFGRSLWGYGPESFYSLGLTTDTVVDGEVHTTKVESCDSAVVELMMDTGYVGFLLIAILLVKAMLLAFRQYLRQPGPEGSLCLVLGVNIAAFSFMMTNVELFGWGQQTYMLWIEIALVMISLRSHQHSGTLHRKSQRIESATQFEGSLLDVHLVGS